MNPSRASKILDRALSIVMVCLLVVLPSPAHAAAPKDPPPKDMVRINALVDEAGRLAAARDYDGAFAKLHQANGIGETCEVFVSLGNLYMVLGRLAEARSQFSRCTGDDAAENARTKARQKLVEIERLERTGYLVLTVTPSDARVLVDGRTAPLDERGRYPLPLGEHTLDVTHPDRAAHRQGFVIAGNQTTSIQVTLTEVKVKEVVKTVEVGDPGVDFGAWPWVTLTTGLVAAGVGTYFVIDGTEDWNAVQATTPRDEADALVDRGRDKRTIGFAALGVGGALGVTSIVLFLLERDPSEASTSLDLLPLPGGAHASLHFSF